jgi:putative sigma-54 modulation protein
MSIQISGQAFEITPPIKAYAEKKLTKLKEYFHQITDISIVLHVDKKIHQIAKGCVALPQKNVIHAEAESKDMYASIDALTKKLGEQIKKYKGKHANHHE